MTRRGIARVLLVCHLTRLYVRLLWWERVRGWNIGVPSREIGRMVLKSLRRRQKETTPR